VVVRLNTFGRPRITVDDGSYIVLQPLPAALLCYLAAGGPRDRDHLADLFWHTNKNGLNSLSTTLNRIRADIPGGVWVQGNTLVGTDLPSDIRDLRDAIGRAELESAEALVDAPFLDGVKLRRPSLEFEEWVVETRATLAATAEAALLRRGRIHYDSGAYGPAADVAEQAWKIALRDGFPSPNCFDEYHQLLASDSRPSASAVRTMAHDFGIDLPPVKAIALGQTARSDDASPAETSTIIGTKNQLFGCQDELQAIASSVATRRLTTIVGLGGSGKTRLTREFFAAQQTQEDFPHRFWVNLVDVTQHDLVAPAIAAALGYRFTSVEALAAQLPDEPVLLVLDNFEHLLEAAAVAHELVQHSESVHVLATSRVPLGLASESLIQLTGLKTSGESPDSPAEQLFIASARRVGVSDDQLGGPDHPAISDVCRRVGGNPLALELAGGWVQLLSPAEILDALSRSADLLDTSLVGDLRSMDAVLRQSWSSLADAEQQALMLLATFPAGCLAKEALALRELPTRSIGHLVKHSMVNMQIEGRITLHPLVADHAISERDQRPDLHHQFHQVLSTWCTQFSASIQKEPTSTQSRAYGAELANFTSAWLWAAHQRQWDLHRATLAPLRLFFADSGRISEGRPLLAAIADGLRSDPDGPPDLLAAVLEALGLFDVLSGQLGRAEPVLQEALSLIGDESAEIQAQVLQTTGYLQLATGQADAAATSFTAGLNSIGKAPSALTAKLQHDLAQVHHHRGERDLAASAARSALQSARSADDPTGMTRSYLLLADIEVETDPGNAVVLLNEGWAIAREASLDGLAIYFPHILGLAHLTMRKGEVAEDYFTQGMQAAHDLGQLPTVCANFIGRAEARLLQDNAAGAVEDLTDGIRLALKTSTGRYLMWAAVVSCRAARSRPSSAPQAKELLFLALQHPATDAEARMKAIDDLQTIYEEPVPANYGIDGEPPSFDEIAERSLRLITSA